MRAPVLLFVCLVSTVAVAETTSPEFLSAYDKDPKAKAIARSLFESYGHVTGPGKDEVMDGGYRGKIHLVPEMPKSKYRQQLVWVS